MSTANPDFAAIKQRQQATWASGDYAVVGTTLANRRRALCEAVDLTRRRAVYWMSRPAMATPRWRRPAGSPKSHRPTMSRRCSIAAKSAPPPSACPVTFQVRPTPKLPFADARFDVVAVGLRRDVYAEPGAGGQELLRVCRPGGTIGLANWTPDGFIGHVFRTIGKYVPPPWASNRRRCGGRKPGSQNSFPDIMSRPPSRFSIFATSQPAHWLDIFKSYYGPTNRAFAALDSRRGRHWRPTSRIDAPYEPGRQRQAVVPSEYLEVVITRQK